MRSTILAALLTTTTLALAACGGEEPAPVPPPPPPPPPVATVVAPPADTTPPPPPKPALAELIHDSLKAMHDGFNAHDPAKMVTAVTDDVVVQDYGHPDAHGKAEFQSAMTRLFGWCADAKVAANRVWKKGNVVITESTWSGTMTGDLMGIPASHKPIGQMRVHVYLFNDDGLIKEVHEYGDDGGLLAQIQGKKDAPPVPILPTNPPEMHIAGGNPEQDKLGDWAKGTDDAFNKDDVKAVLAITPEDGDLWSAMSGKPAIKGTKDLTKEYTEWFRTFPDQKWAPTQAWGIDGFGIVEHTMTGTMKGPFGKIPATGKKLAGWHFIDIMQPTADGKILHDWSYANSMEGLGQLGALPKPPPAKGKPAAPVLPKKP